MASQHERRQLPGKRLGGGHADFRPGMRQNRSRRFARDHGAEDVADGQRFRALLLGLALRGQSVRGFAGLADANRQRFGIDDRVAIAEFAAVIHFDGNFREPLDHELAGLPGVPAGAAGDDLDVGESPEFLLGDVHLVEEDFGGIERHAGEQGVPDGAGLLKDFLLHEMLEAALFRHDGVPGDMLHGALDGVAVEIHDADALRREHGDVAVGQEEHVARVGKNRGNVAGHEILALAQADDRRRPGARRNDLVRVRRGKNGQGIDAGELLHRFPHGVFERAAVLHVLFHQVGDDFGIGFGDELVALFFQLALELDVIFHDAVMDDDDLAGAVAMRMRVFFGGTAVRGPARMADAVRALHGRLPDDLFEIVQFARGAADLHLAVVSDHGDAGRVIAAIFQPPQAVEDEGNDLS